MMNLNALAGAAIASIEPPLQVLIRRSIGSGEDASGRVVPQYADPIETQGDKQSLSGSDVYKLQGLNVQGVVCKMYLNGNYEGLFRATGGGGDLLIFENQTYLVGAVLERWSDWCCLALTMQTDGAA